MSEPTLEIPSSFFTPAFLRIPEFCTRNAMSRAKAYILIRNGELRALKIGGSTRIALEDEATWRASLRPMRSNAAA